MNWKRSEPKLWRGGRKCGAPLWFQLWVWGYRRQAPAHRAARVHSRIMKQQPFESLVNRTRSLSPPLSSSFCLCQEAGRSWVVLMETLLLPFPLFATLMWKAPSMLLPPVAMTSPACHSPTISELMGRPRARATHTPPGGGGLLLHCVLRL